jgi:hypothetical protein
MRSWIQGLRVRRILILSLIVVLILFLIVIFVLILILFRDSWRPKRR